MLDTLRRLDRGWARVEGWLIVAVLILMVLVAGFAAGIRNLTLFDISWANRLLNDMDWADSLLRKGTLWLAFIGASLATYERKHINIDIVMRLVSPKAKFTMMAICALSAGLITLALTYSFSSAVYLNLTERPVEYELLGDHGSMHVCDATDAQLKNLVDFEKPTMFCIARTVLSVFAVPAETPGAAFQLIVPFTLFVMALRFLGQGVAFTSIILGGPEALARAEEEEERMVLAQQAQVTTALENFERKAKG
jgi:TRAP-type C4-dicarboxylate transport system permease small subunit